MVMAWSSNMNGQSIYVVVPYWLLYLNLKLLLAKLSHFSEICRAFDAIMYISLGVKGRMGGRSVASFTV
jgi:hypothetical protein